MTEFGEVLDKKRFALGFERRHSLGNVFEEQHGVHVRIVMMCDDIPKTNDLPIVCDSPCSLRVDVFEPLESFPNTFEMSLHHRFPIRVFDELGFRDIGTGSRQGITSPSHVVEQFPGL